VFDQRPKREIIFPMHPRTTIKLNGITVPPNIRITAPLGLYDFNHLLKGSCPTLVLRQRKASSIGSPM
jgi:UDP-N-acetylglucosamine 2-epimerase (non-hydrolysing)